MKLKLFLLATVSAFACSLNACPDPSLSRQYETGALQWQVIRKEIDPNTLIHQAILENAPEVVRFLLDHGVKVDYPDENGMSPLTIAVLIKASDAVKLLLIHGANPNPAVKWNNMSLLELAFSMSDVNSIKLLIDYGADVNVKMQNGCALSTAISRSNSSDKWKEIAILMINKGANIHPSENSSPLSEAFWVANRGDFLLFEFLLQKGANVNEIRLC